MFPSARARAARIAQRWSPVAVGFIPRKGARQFVDASRSGERQRRVEAQRRYATLRSTMIRVPWDESHGYWHRPRSARPRTRSLLSDSAGLTNNHMNSYNLPRFAKRLLVT